MRSNSGSKRRFRSQGEDRGVGVVQADLFLNFTIVILLLIGAQEMLPEVQGESGRPESQSSTDAFPILLRDERFYVGEHPRGEVTLDELKKQVSIAASKNPSGKFPVVIRHSRTPSGPHLHAVLLAVQQVAPTATTRLALCEFRE